MEPQHPYALSPVLYPVPQDREQNPRLLAEAMQVQLSHPSPLVAFQFEAKDPFIGSNFWGALSSRL